MRRTGRHGPATRAPTGHPHSQISTIAIDLFTAKGFDEDQRRRHRRGRGHRPAHPVPLLPQQNAIAWGFRRPSRRDAHTARTDPRRPTHRAGLQQALVTFNEVPGSELGNHHRRAAASGSTCAVQAYSMLMYAGLAAGDAGFCAAPGSVSTLTNIPADHRLAVPGVRRWPHTSSGSPIPTPTRSI